MAGKIIVAWMHRARSPFCWGEGKRLRRFVTRNPPHGNATRLACVSRPQQSSRRRRLENASTYVATRLAQRAETGCRGTETRGGNIPWLEEILPIPGKIRSVPSCVLYFFFSRSLSLLPLVKLLRVLYPLPMFSTFPIRSLSLSLSPSLFLYLREEALFDSRVPESPENPGAGNVAGLIGNEDRVEGARSYSKSRLSRSLSSWPKQKMASPATGFEYPKPLKGLRAGYRPANCARRCFTLRARYRRHL